MERQTAEIEERGIQQTDISQLQARLLKLSTDEYVHHLKRHNVQSHAHEDTASKSVFYYSLELDCEHTNEDGNYSDCSVRPDGDEERLTSSETEQVNKAVEGFRGSTDVVRKWERRTFLPNPLSQGTQGDEPKRSQWPKEGNPLIDNKELGMDEDMAGAAVFLAPCQQSCKFPSQLSMSSKRDDLSQTEAKDALPEEACVCPPKRVCGRGNGVTHQTPVNITSKTTRSASEPVAHKPKEERPISAPCISHQQENEDSGDLSMNNSRKLGKAKHILVCEDLCMEGSTGVMAHENSVSKMQKKGKKIKNLTQKLMGRLKEKQNEHTGSKRSSDSGEEEEQTLSSMSPPPLPPKKQKYVCLERTFTLKDFKLNLEPINLMDEIFQGEEWLKYLPSKTTPPQTDIGNQLTADNVLHPEKDIQLHNTQFTPEKDQSKDRKYNQLDTDQDNLNKTQLDYATKVNRHLHVRQVKPNSNIFAIPKALLTNDVIKQRTSGLDCESNASNVINNGEGVFMISKHDFQLLERKLEDVSLDFSTVKSLGLLDNSTLKSRIHLSQKRQHRPPKRNKKGKTEKINATFYKIPPILNESSVGAFSPLPFSTSPPLHSPAAQTLPMTP
ncbi:uncharacterized protein LOC127651960 [Xyrauchen texanus]|uniref:uncharacterized protein LOC127651960 n=1 Tax=Xyrauchen texanus TaxID=154827 RepID=UPI0022425D64|nr:uncharacterized protein LOC127651960 [Xyrauchen texanus]